MVCKECGGEIFEATNLCPYCGAEIKSDAENTTAAEYAAEPVVDEAAKSKLGGSALTFSIIGLVLGWIGIPIGIILSLMARTKINAFVAAYGAPSGKVKTAKILSIIGIIVNILSLVTWLICALILVVYIAFIVILVGSL